MPEFYVKSTVQIKSRVRYMHHYSRDASFDNHYLNSALEKWDQRAEKSIFPLTSRDKKKYIAPAALRMLPHER